MSRTVKTSLRSVVSIMLLTAVAMAHASTNHIDKKTTHEHHSRLSKLAFWRGHKGHDRTGGKVANVHQKNEEHHGRISKLAFWRHARNSDKSVKAAQANQVSPKSVQVKAAQTKPAPHTLSAGKKEQNQDRSGSRTPAKTTSPATKRKGQPTTQERTAASLKQ